MAINKDGYGDKQGELWQQQDTHKRQTQKKIRTKINFKVRVQHKTKTGNTGWDHNNKVCLKINMFIVQSYSSWKKKTFLNLEDVAVKRISV